MGHDERNKQRKKEKEKRKELGFLDLKASFIASIIALVTAIKNFVITLGYNKPWIFIVYAIFAWILFIRIYGGNHFDRIIQKYKDTISSIASVCTVFAIVLFIIENSVMLYIDRLAACTIGLMIISLLWSVLYIIFTRRKRH